MWMRLTNMDFNGFSIEDAAINGTETEFYVTQDTKNELKKFLNSKNIDREKKLNYLNLLIFPPIVQSVEQQTLSMLNLLTLTLTEGTLIGQGDRYVTFKYSSRFLDSSAYPSINDGEKFESKNIQLPNVSLHNDEYVLFYESSNLLGSFKGYILTNMRLIATGTSENFSLDWKDLKSTKRKLFGKCIINDTHKVDLSSPLCKIIESMLEYDFIVNPIIARKNGSFDKYSIMSFDRFTYEKYNGYLNDINQLTKIPFYLYIKSINSKIPIGIDKKIYLSELTGNSNDSELIAHIEPHPKKKGAFIIRNLSNRSWKYKVEDKQYTIEPQQARALIPNGIIEINGIEVKVNKES